MGVVGRGRGVKGRRRRWLLRLQVKAEEVGPRVRALQEELKAARAEAAQLRAELAVRAVERLAESAEVVGPGKTK